MSELGELQRVSLDNHWPDEAKDFTPWLADNLTHLEQVLDLTLTLKGTEENVGDYFADIYAITELGDETRDVIIENQYGGTDHDHLGKSIVYAGGFDADIIIWLAEEFNDAHIDAIQWFNERTSDDTGLFGVKLELVQIDGSPFAPIFTVVERPSRWKALTGDMTETDRKHYRFWSHFEDRLAARGLEHYQKGPSTSASYGVPDNLDGASIRLASTLRGNRIECALRITDPDGNLGGLDQETVRQALRSTISEIDTYELTESIVDDVEFVTREEKKYDKITLYYPGKPDRNNRDEWESYHDWLIDAICVYDDVFSEWF